MTTPNPTVPIYRYNPCCDIMSKLDIILNDGSRIPWLGLGTGTALYRQDATQLIFQAIEAGGTHLDGAQVYKNEDTLGQCIKALEKPHSSFFVTTKLNLLSGDQTVKDSLLKSLQNLGLAYVDLFLIRDPSPHQKEGRLKDDGHRWSRRRVKGLPNLLECLTSKWVIWRKSFLVRRLFLQWTRFVKITPLAKTIPWHRNR